ncbi:MAG: phage baseplate assembly protein domain-containing protein [Hyphomicrobiaceae bacterium]
MFHTDMHTARLTIRRVELLETDDAGELQLVTVRGYADEVLKGAHRVQMFGETSHAPAGAHGLALLVNGRPDQSIVLGLEHPTHRPKGIGAGERVLYNAHGDIIGIYKQKIRIVTQEFEVVAPTIKLTGDITHTGNMDTTGVHTDSNGVHV